MPILEVELVTGPGETPPPGLAQRLADVAGEVLKKPAGRTWVRLRTLPRERYAENLAAVPETVRPVFVTLLKARNSPVAETQEEAARLCEAIARACGRPMENVHILYLPEASGRLSFGGKLVP